MRATADELAQVKIPTSDLYDPYTRFWPRRSRPGERPVTRLAGHLNGWLEQSPWGDAILLAHRLSSGTDSELEVVRRVEDYLTGGHFRYTTDVKEPGSDPLFEFLFETRAGYCQHFAGAAALLLRLAGVPTRVVSGFATGKRTGENTYTVRDEDAHAWIEVYFPGYGWVPFNPTPSAAEADVAPETDVLAAASSGRRDQLGHAGRGADRDRTRRAGRGGPVPAPAPRRDRGRRGAGAADARARRPVHDAEGPAPAPGRDRPVRRRAGRPGGARAVRRGRHGRAAPSVPEGLAGAVA